jgi:hypothetical protein
LQRQLDLAVALVLAGGPDEVVEAGQVDLVTVKNHPVPAAGPHQGAAVLAVGPAGFQQRTDLRGVAMNHAHAGTRRPFTPQHVDDLVAGHQLTGLQRQQAEQCTGQRRADLDLDAVTLER